MGNSFMKLRLNIETLFIDEKYFIQTTTHILYKNIKNSHSKRISYYQTKNNIWMFKLIIKDGVIIIQQQTNMKKVVLILLMICSAYSFGFSLDGLTDIANSIVSGATSTIRSAGQAAISSATSTFNQLQSQTTAFVSQATNSVKSVATTAIQFVTTKANELIDKIKNLSDFMCQNECTSTYNLPCFLLFRCTSKLKKFVLYIALPSAVVTILVCGYFCRCITLSCFCKFVGIITGIYIIILVYEYTQPKPKETKLENVVHQNDHKDSAHKEIADKKINDIEINNKEINGIDFINNEINNKEMNGKEMNGKEMKDDMDLLKGVS